MASSRLLPWSVGGRQVAIYGCEPSNCGSIAGQPLVVCPTLAGVVVFPMTLPRLPASLAADEVSMVERLPPDDCPPSSPAQGRRRLPVGAAGCLLGQALLGTVVLLLRGGGVESME